MSAPLSCRACGAPLRHSFVDLGKTPLANSYLDPDRAGEAEAVYDLHARVCDACFLVQVEDVVPAEAIFTDYAYFSSYSESWVEHARRYALGMIGRFGLDGRSQVVEVASNDGYLLRHFVAAGIPVLGIEPAANVAAVARAQGVPTETVFFGRETARDLRDRGLAADLIAANNVLAHVPDINGFVAGIAALLKPAGVWTVEFPHLLNLIEQVQFDTIYHEHFSYLSLLAVESILERNGLRAFDVEELPTHGGSLRVFVGHRDGPHGPCPGLDAVRAREARAGLDRLETYAGFGERVRKVRDDLLGFLAGARREGRAVAAYGAAAKGNTLLNYCGIGTDDIRFVVDRSPHKQGRLLPGSHIPILPLEVVERERPDYLLILPWNLREEIAGAMAGIRGWGGRFVVAIPRLEVF
ncbi:class I SAM-dependent methyltransferase [Rhodospirillum centenum]|uniref:Methyltransferase, putative n=1 Tax=Rhodospirillum centenum (strain ATCC 51521 / SW) TaxID=414684 RepID=B6IXU7_RHOCS|nr:class I SAM-dependent methyltransferase [Rhodospirillum centenum]ACJ01121.1 methyltransferase, putative [Rhodospirillum centenum SW]